MLITFPVAGICDLWRICVQVGALISPLSGTFNMMEFILLGHSYNGGSYNDRYTSLILELRTVSFLTENGHHESASLNEITLY